MARWTGNRARPVAKRGFGVRQQHDQQQHGKRRAAAWLSPPSHGCPRDSLMVVRATRSPRTRPYGCPRGRTSLRPHMATAWLSPRSFASRRGHATLYRNLAKFLWEEGAPAPTIIPALPLHRDEHLPMDEDGLFERISWQLEAAPFDAQQKREVLARFGLAAYYGQCVERQIALMLATMYNKTNSPGVAGQNGHHGGQSAGGDVRDERRGQTQQAQTLKRRLLSR